jgi:hypothetical protein
VDALNVAGAQYQRLNLAGFQIVQIIPEPATIGMLGLGALVTLLLRRMRS